MAINNLTRKIAVWVTYPLVMIITLIIYYAILAQGIDCSMASYIAAIIGGVILITALEHVLPYRDNWSADKSEVKTDITFMLLVQIALPRLLSLMTAMWLVEQVNHNGNSFQAWWPHHLAVWQQMLIMMCLADLPRYWLHRTAHEWAPLWKFHAVHHSVEKLNWINVGRFHPVDKSLQFVCDTLPFILLGLSREVLALYFVVYSIKGFFQHSNVDVKLGWLNYIISGPELHRWHHSRTIKEANTNYGNNIIFWDILFGTFFYPKEKTVGDLGLIDRDYPVTFMAQIKEPFIGKT